MKSPVVKRSIAIAGHKTSVSLEHAFWTGLKEIAEERRISLSDMVAQIDARRQHGNLSSAIRLFVLDACRTQIAEVGDERSDRGSPPLVPAAEGDVLLVLCELGKGSASYVETDPADAGEPAIVRNMLEGRYARPLRVAAINLTEGRARDVSRKIAATIAEEARRGERTLPNGTRAFVEAQLGGSQVRS